MESQYFPLRSIRRQARTALAPPAASFEGKTVLLTGATGAICGRAARILAEKGVEMLVLGVRDLGKGNRVAATLVDGLVKKPTVLVWKLDLSNFESVRTFASKAGQLPRLDLAIMGAAQISRETTFTADGWETTLQISHLSTSLLAVLLAPSLVRSAEKHLSPSVLVSVSSFAVCMAGASLSLPRRPGTGSLLVKANRVRPLRQSMQYSKSKLLHLYFLRHFCQVHGSDAQLMIHSVDPGTTPSGLSTANRPARLLGKFTSRALEMSARAVVGACIPRTGSHGAMLMDYDVVPYPKFMDSEKGQKTQALVWKESIESLASISPEFEDYLSTSCTMADLKYYPDLF